MLNVVFGQCSMCPLTNCGVRIMANPSAKAFAQRFKQACDDSVTVPEYGKGRQVVIAKKLSVTQEAVRKWFEGDAMPKPPKMKALANFLDVDEAWLALGTKAEVDRNERRRLNRLSSGAVCMVTGLILMEGGNVAGPRDDDPRRDHVDLYAIMRGVQIAIYVSSSREIEKGVYEFVVPRDFKDVRCVGFINLGAGRFTLLDMSTALIEKHKQRKSGDFSVKVTQVANRYMTDSDEWVKFKTFGEIV